MYSLLSGKMLAALADAYRKSKKDSGTNRINRRTGLKPEKLYPQYRQNSGEPAEISAFNTAAEDCRKMGFVTILKSISEIAPYVPFGISKTTLLLKDMGKKDVVKIEDRRRGTKYVIK